MYELLNPDLENYSRATISRHISFERGEWNQSSLTLYQSAQIRETVQHVLDGSPFYKDHLATALETISIGDITTETLVSLPFTTKDDLREAGFDMLSKAVNEAWVFYETTGTTGKATPCPRDNVDSTVSNTALTVNYASVLRRHPRRHIVGVMGPTELHSTGDAFGEVFRNLGQCVVKMWPHSPVVGYDRALEVMDEIGITALVCTPGMAMSLARHAIGCGRDPRHMGIDFIMVVGELVTPALRSCIGDIWSSTVYNCMYASQEASIMAAVRGDGLLRTVPLNNFYEIIDSETGVRIPPDSRGNRVGELVVTHLFQGCKPLIRYRTGDLVQLSPGSAESSYPSDTLTPLGRARDTIVIRTKPFTAYALEELILTGVCSCYGYQVVIGEDGRDSLHVTFEFMNVEAAGLFDRRACADRLQNAFHVPVAVDVGPIGTIAGTGAMVSWKASRIHDRRNADDPERRVALAIAAQRNGHR